MQPTLFETTSRPQAIRSNRVDVVTVQLVKEKSIRYTTPDAETLTDPTTVADVFCRMIGNPDREIFAVLILDGRNRINSIHQVSQGSLNQSIVHPREVFKAAILANAAALILVHNHPTGNLSPSREDMEITRRLKEAGELLGIKILDHIIVDTETGKHHSFVASGQL